MPMTPHQKRKEKYKPIFLVDIKIPNKMLGIHIQQHIKLYTTTKQDLYQVSKASSTFKRKRNHYNPLHKYAKEGKAHDDMYRYRSI